MMRMKRLLAVTLALTLLPATAVLAVDLQELLEQSGEASYSADQLISCATPDGSRDALVHIEQAGKALRISSTIDDDVEVSAGAGSWAFSGSDGLVSAAAVDRATNKTDPLYVVEDGVSVEFLGRSATAYRLFRDEELRAQLIFDDESGAMVQATTYTDGSIYCQRRFVSLDVAAPDFSSGDTSNSVKAPNWVEESTLPFDVAGFDRLDHYVDDDGVEFAYYSDGFFSFAIFQTPTKVVLSDGITVEVDDAGYEREFTAGQVTYAWETSSGGLALVGDLPPDLHAEVLAAMPEPHAVGLFRRWWRSIFG